MRTQLLLAVAVVAVAACSYRIDDCARPSEGFSLDEVLDEHLVERLVIDSRVLNHTELECKVVCELIYLDRHPKGATTEVEFCELTIDGDFTGDPDAVVGAVTCKQRPQTAHGVTFLTLEDEAGMLNVIVWATVRERHELLLRSASVLGVTGKIQSAYGVVHLVAESLWDPRAAVLG